MRAPKNQPLIIALCRITQTDQNKNVIIGFICNRVFVNFHTGVLYFFGTPNMQLVNESAGTAFEMGVFSTHLVYSKSTSNGLL